MERRAVDADGVLAAPLVVVCRRGVAGETLFRRLAGAHHQQPADASLLTRQLDGEMLSAACSGSLAVVGRMCVGVCGGWREQGVRGGGGGGKKNDLEAESSRRWAANDS
jgi:hypothetical protein